MTIFNLLLNNYYKLLTVNSDIYALFFHQIFQEEMAVLEVYEEKKEKKGKKEEEKIEEKTKAHSM